MNRYCHTIALFSCTLAFLVSCGSTDENLQKPARDLEDMTMDPTDLRIEMPVRISVGEPFSPRVTAGKRDLWLIVMTCDENDECWILRPSPDMPAEMVPAHQTLTLAPMVAGAPSRERLVVYGFPKKRDYERFSPPSRVLTESECTQYARDLFNRLDERREIPTNRYRKAAHSFEVKKAARRKRAR